jgi:hypothetical protein
MDPMPNQQTTSYPYTGSLNGFLGQEFQGYLATGEQLSTSPSWKILFILTPSAIVPNIFSDHNPEGYTLSIYRSGKRLSTAPNDTSFFILTSLTIEENMFLDSQER